MIKKVIFAISNTKISAQEIELFKQNQIYGFILFGRNIINREQVKKLTTSLKNLYPDRFVPIFIDQEGGRVARLKHPIVSKDFPAAAHFSGLYQRDKEKAKKAVYENYYQLMSELKELGIDSPLAPVADLNYSWANAVIGERSFGDNVEQVSDLAIEAIDAIEDVGGIACLKHMPGHGRAQLDSHFALPIITDDLTELENTDFRVFANLAPKARWAMTAHIMYQILDAEQPVTLSKKLQEYIRNQIGFQGYLVTDDICMYALHGEVGEKLACLKKVQELIGQNQEWRSDFGHKLEIILQRDINLQDEVILHFCQQEQKLMQPKFLASLQNVVRIASNICNYILHCSGEIEEMRLICKLL